MRHVRRLRSTPPVLAALLCGAVVLLVPPTAHARPDPARATLRLVAPLDDASINEAGLRFVWGPAVGRGDRLLLVSERPFETRGRDRLPNDGAIRAIRVRGASADWEIVGRPLEADTRIYWAVAELNSDASRATFSEVRTAFVVRRFSQRAEASPLVSVSSVEVARPAAPVRRRIHLEAGYTIDPALGEPALPASLRESAVAPGGRRSLLVHYGDADAEATRRAIADAGGLVVAYVPDHTFLVRLDAASDLSFGGRGAWVGAYQPGYKLSRRLAARAPEVLNVLLFPDGDLQGAAATARGAGGDVLLASDTGRHRLLRVRGNRVAAEALARDPGVAWIEPYVPAEALNDQVQWIVQTGANGNRRLWDLGLHGEGQVVMSSDTGLNVDHFAFRDPLVKITDFGSYPTHRKVIACQKGLDVSTITLADHGVFHGTHTAGTLEGNDDPLSTSPRDGVAKAARLWFVGLSGPTLGNGIVTPPDLNDLFEPSYEGNAGGAARISTNSWGSAVNGAYTIDSYTLDEFVWNHPDYLPFFANGNASAPGSVDSPATAKNCVSVGATGNGLADENDLASYTSRGPTLDGRRKPTLCAPGGGASPSGLPVYSSTTDSATYGGLYGTSMASPAAAGCATLIRQYLTEGWYPTGTRVAADSIVPSAALLKAMCVNAAGNTISGQSAPDDDIGWGRIDADSVLYFAGDARRLLVVDEAAGLTTGQALEYRINVVNTSLPLKVALCWTDYPGHPAAAVQLVNDLDLTVSHGPTTFHGNWYLNGASTPGGVRDSLNVEECVRIATPVAGIWTVRIEGHDIPAGPEPFGLVITGGIGTTAGALAVDRASYGSGGTVRLRVTDTDAPPSVQVAIASTSEPAGESVTLSGSSGILEGSIPLSPFAGSAGDGVLRVSNGDTITATYADASPPATIVATAQVSLVTPVITSVHAAGAGSGSELVTWTTSVDADSRVYYGATPALGLATAPDTLEVAQHSETLTGLTPGQIYCFDVESRDPDGNVSRDDNGGAHYRFSVDPHSDILLVYDGVEFERDDRYASALAATGRAYDVWARELSDSPRLGDAADGLRSYKAVWWQNGVEHYPPFTDAARDSLGAYLAGGGRLAVVGHDIGWANMYPGSPYYTAARAAWMTNTLHTQYMNDPTTWSGVTGIAADPISGAYAGGAPYTPYRDGAAGDEVSLVTGAGTGSTDWRSGDLSPDPCGFRWESSGPLGTPGTGVWGGAPSRLATMYFEWSALDPANDPSPIRQDVLQKTLVWLIGRDQPHAGVTAPNGGEVIGGATTPISWSETVSGGTSVATRRLEYSLDGGQSWTTITASAGPSPYSWDVSGLPNTTQARVRVRITDTGSPALSGVDASDAVFTIVHGGGDAAGPVVVAGSVRVSPNPIDMAASATLTASLTDLGTGGANVAAAEWSYGAAPKPPGTGAAMAGAFNASTVSVSAALPTASFVQGIRMLWVRGRDAAGNWGPAASLAVVINGASPTGVPDRPLDYSLAPATPNPAYGRAIVSYSLPQRGPADLAVFDVGGRRVRALVSGPVEAGIHSVDWDLRDDGGRLVKSGIYYYRLCVAGRAFTRRLAVLE